MTQCESKVFFPDDPAQPPQFNDCPRKAVTTRQNVRLADRVNYTIKLCGVCAGEWDEQTRYAERIEQSVKAAGA